MPEPADRPPLRDQLREALTTERWGSEHALGEHGTGHSFYAPCGICQGDVAAIIRLVMPVVQTALAEVERQRDEALAAVADEQQRADERSTELLEERDEALDALADAERQAREQVAAEYQDLLASIWLYVKWRYVTKQLTTEQKELWADAVEAASDPGDPPTADRWWRE